jgi:hypothetical protein
MKTLAEFFNSGTGRNSSTHSLCYEAKRTSLKLKTEAKLVLGCLLLDLPLSPMKYLLKFFAPKDPHLLVRKLVGRRHNTQENDTQHNDTHHKECHCVEDHYNT